MALRDVRCRGGPAGPLALRGDGGRSMNERALAVARHNEGWPVAEILTADPPPLPPLLATPEAIGVSLTARDVQHRDDFVAYALGQEHSPWHRAVLTRLYADLAAWNAAYYAGVLKVPYLL